MDLKAGLNGRAVSGQANEIKIRLFATAPVEAELEIQDANGLTTLAVQLDEQREKTLWLPVNPKAHGPIVVVLKTNGGLVIKKELEFELSHTPLTVVSSTIPAGETFRGHQQSGAIVPVILSTTGLPHVSQAYASVGAIVTNARSLSNLAQDQYHALSHYLSQCGIMLLSDADPALLDRLRNISACGGCYVHTFGDLSEVSAILLRLNAERPLKAPPPQDLIPLQQPAFQRRMITSLSVYLGGYMLLIALAAWHMNKTHYLLVLPALAAAAGALAWSGAGGHQLITWAQTVSGDNHTRVTSVLLLGGDRQGSNEITLGLDIQLSNVIGETQASSIHYQDDGRHRLLSAYTHLLTPHACQLVSVSRYSPPFSLTLKHGHPQVILQAAAFPAKTRLLWRGHAYSVPSLTKGRTWQPTEAIGNLPASPAEKLLNRRLAFDEPALLLPFGAETADNSEPDTQTTGWLVIRHDSGRV